MDSTVVEEVLTAAPVETEDVLDENEEYLSGFKLSAATAASSFVRKLYDMVDGDNLDIIAWLPDGTSFEVLHSLHVSTNCNACFAFHKGERS
jgi:hypothetical protein